MTASSDRAWKDFTGTWDIWQRRVGRFACAWVAVMAAVAGGAEMGPPSTVETVGAAARIAP